MPIILIVSFIIAIPLYKVYTLYERLDSYKTYGFNVYKSYEEHKNNEINLYFDYENGGVTTNEQ